MHVNALTANDFITAEAFAGKTPTLTIAGCKRIALYDEKRDGEKNKGTVWFKETDLGMVLNKTNATCFAAMFGPETDAWTDKRVTLKAELVQFGRDKVLGIRVVGSPDLAAPVDAVVKLPRKKPVTMRMMPTGGQRQQQDPPPSEPAPREPGQD